jgi:hypothetical protein
VVGLCGAGPSTGEGEEEEDDPCSGAARVLVSGPGAGGQEALVGALVAVLEGGAGEVHSASVSSMVMAGHGDAGQVRATPGGRAASQQGSTANNHEGGPRPRLACPPWRLLPLPCSFLVLLPPIVRPLLFLSGAHMWLSPYRPRTAWFEGRPGLVCRACPAFWPTPVPGVRPSW